MKTKDNYELYVGMWISNHDGVFEIKEIQNNCIYAKEIVFEDDNTDNYHYGDELRMSKEEIKNLDI